MKSPFEIALFSPRIAQNVGAIGRLAAVLSVPLSIIRPIPFQLDDKTLKRAGMDYWDRVDFSIHNSFSEFQESKKGRICLLTTKANKDIFEFDFQSNDCLLFGNEPHGVTDEVADAIPAEQKIKIPMPDSESRSLNLAMSCAIASYEALRQLR